MNQKEALDLIVEFFRHSIKQDENEARRCRSIRNLERGRDLEQSVEKRKAILRKYEEA
jgi:hypothetical protein